MKLYNILFETVSENQIVLAIKDMLKTNSETAQYIKSFAINNNISAIAKEFYQQNKTQFDKATNQATEFKHLGGGQKGNAFSLGTQILKIELVDSANLKFSSKIRAEKAATDLFGKPAASPTKQLFPYQVSATAADDTTKPIREALEKQSDNLGEFVPMIYDQGTMKFPNIAGQNIAWIVMEKFEIPSKKNKQLLDSLINHVIQRFISKESLQDVIDHENLPKHILQLVATLSDNLRLKDNWYQKLVQGMWNLKHKGIADFKADNLGVRRLGAQGTLVFFD